MSETDHIQRLILSLIIHSSKDEDHAIAMKTLDSTFTGTISLLTPVTYIVTTFGQLPAVCDSDVELGSVPTTACLTVSTAPYISYSQAVKLMVATLSDEQLIWQYGGRHYKSKRWSEAADWYLAGSHSLFKTKSPSSSAKCFRKAALCYIEQRDYALASTVIRRCPTTDAPTHYLSFLTAIHQGSCLGA